MTGHWDPYGPKIDPPKPELPKVPLPTFLPKKRVYERDGTYKEV